METLYNKNSLVFWSEKDLILRKFFEDIITIELKECLLSLNPAFSIVKCDAPLFIPNEFVHKNYTSQDVYFQDVDDIALSDSTKNDYYPHIVECINNIVSKYVNPSHIEESDRLPSYSEVTTDVVMDHNNMEVCSISKRTDFTLPNVLVIEVALGTDRLIFNK